MFWLEQLLRTTMRAATFLRLIPARFAHRTRQPLTEYLGAVVVLGAVGLAAASVGVV